jgi:hypothetical protein
VLSTQCPEASHVNDVHPVVVGYAQPRPIVVHAVPSDGSVSGQIGKYSPGGEDEDGGDDDVGAALGIGFVPAS